MEVRMDNSELEKKLRAARGPVLDGDYEAAFTRKVLANLRSDLPKPAPVKHPWRPRLAWGFATVLCILVAFAAGHWHGRMEADRDVLANSKLVGETLAMFPNRVRAIVHDERGMNLVLSDRDNVPASTPIYVRICDGKNCSSLVTFSGQEIQIGGQKLTVLSEADGGIILEGNKFVWSTDTHNYAYKGLRIEARALPVGAM
jgi:hypothetical protein